VTGVEIQVLAQYDRGGPPFKELDRLKKLLRKSTRYFLIRDVWVVEIKPLYSVITARHHGRPFLIRHSNSSDVAASSIPCCPSSLFVIAQASIPPFIDHDT
jgi:hypothetical protein